MWYDLKYVCNSFYKNEFTSPKLLIELAPVKVKSYTIPTVTHAERVSRSTPPPPPLSSSLPSSSGPRTIWDSEIVGSWTPPPATATTATTEPTSFIPHRDHIEPTRPGSLLIFSKVFRSAHFFGCKYFVLEKVFYKNQLVTTF